MEWTLLAFSGWARLVKMKGDGGDGEGGGHQSLGWGASTLAVKLIGIRTCKGHIDQKLRIKAKRSMTLYRLAANAKFSLRTHSGILTLAL